MIIGIVGAVVFGATRAFFSDTETSYDNTFVAGDIDLQIDNESYAIDYNIPQYDGTPVGALVLSGLTSWPMGDLDLEKFFDFRDLKPGDYGEDTISVHVGSNNAWLCAAAQITDDSDQTCTEPELEDDANCAEPGEGLGELDEGVNFAFWVDDGDNVLESDEKGSIFLNGPLSGLSEAGQIALADSEHSILGGNEPIPGGTTFYIGKAWCFGNLTPDPVEQGEGGPLDRETTGFNCDGSQVKNAAQTDQVVGDLQFYAEQSRNNGQFLCSNWTPNWERPEEP